MGHHVTVHSVEDADRSTLAHEHGLPFALDDDLLEPPDAIIAQDAVVSYQLAGRFPRVPQLYVAHSHVHDLQVPPQLPDVVGILVALNGRMAHWLEALGTSPAVVRLRQPVHIDYFATPHPVSPRPERLLSLGNRMTPARRADLAGACETLEIEYEEVGNKAGRNVDPAHAIADADIVVGYGRCVIEAMAAGRAAYVYDHAGADGWVTPATWERLEEGGFAGRTGLGSVDRGGLVRDLANYHPRMGAENRELARRHHRISAHAVAVVDLLERLAPRAAGADAGRRAGPAGARVAWNHERDGRMKAGHIRALEERGREDRRRARQLEAEIERQREERRRERAESRRLLAEIDKARSLGSSARWPRLAG